MFGCLRTVGCLTLLGVAAVGGYLTRDRWMPAISGERPMSAATFDPVTEARRERARKSLESLSRKAGPVFANITAAEATALVIADARRRLPAFVGPVEAAVIGDRLVLRTTLDPAALKGVESLGPVASLLQSRQQVTLSGTLAVGDDGRGLFVVQDVRVNDLAVPPPAIGALVRQLDRRTRALEEPPRAIAFDLPAAVGDIRVAKGRVTLYKTVQ